MISIHVVVDNASPSRLDRAFDYLVNTKQPAVQVAGGSQIDRAIDFAVRVKSELPACKIFWRILEDTGNIFQMTPAAWWENRIAPRLKWMQALGIIMVVDNESSGNDDLIRRYTSESIERHKMLQDAGLGGAFCRFATGNIKEHQYAFLKPLLSRLTDRDWISPNEYTNLPGKSSDGHLQRYKLIHEAAGRFINTAIGECGILDDYKAHAGYLSVGMPGKTMAAILLGNEGWYLNGKIPRFLFCIGGYQEWETLQVNDEALEYLERYYAEHPIEKLPLPHPPLPPEPGNENSVSVKRSDLIDIKNTLDALRSRIGDILE